MSRHIEAAQERAAGVDQRHHRPSQRRMFESLEDGFRGAAPACLVQRADGEEGGDAQDGASVDWSDPHIFGLASRTEYGYEMWDMFGPYTEVVSLDAFDATLATSPLVEFTLNHNRGGGVPMAHTRNGTLVLEVSKDSDETGLLWDASVDPTRQDVETLLKAYERGDMAEASFKFKIVRGMWSPDYMEYRIHEVDLNRGDVSSVNFGASDGAWSQARESLLVPAEVRASETVAPVAQLRHLPQLRTIPGI